MNDVGRFCHDTGRGTRSVKLFFRSRARAARAGHGRPPSSQGARPASGPPKTIPRPPRAPLAGLSEQDMVSLYGVAAIRAVLPGERVIRDDDDGARAIYVVLDGSLEVSATANGEAVRIGVVGKGACIDTGASPAPVPYGATALEPSTVMEIGPAVLDLLPLPTQLALCRWAAASSAARVTGLLSLHADLAAKNLQLAAALKALEVRSRACLSAPSLEPLLAAIPRLPVYATDLVFKLLNERTPADEVVDSIKNDPSLASLVLKRVNSAYYARPAQISDYYHAFLLLGVNNVYQLILESGVESVVPETAEAREIQVDAHLVSTLAREIALLSTDVPPLLGTTLGLLHNVGRSVALLLKDARPEIAALVDALDPPALGGRVLASWGLPERVFQVIADQRHAEFLPPARLESEHAREIAVLHLAHACHDMLRGRVLRAPYAEEYMRLLGFEGMSLAAFYRDRLAPALARHRDTLPAPVRKLLEERTAPPGTRPA